MLSFENNFSNFHTPTNNKKPHKGYSSKKLGTFVWKILKAVMIKARQNSLGQKGFLRNIKHSWINMREKCKSASKLLMESSVNFDNIWFKLLLTAFIFDFAHLSVVWIFPEVHGTSNVVIVPKNVNLKH